MTSGDNADTLLPMRVTLAVLRQVAMTSRHTCARSTKARSGTMKNQTPALKDAELDMVTGGNAKAYASMMSLLTSLQRLQHDTAKGVIQNMRA